jgi:ATP-binding cassette, subfamily B, multidrug efflux pump
VIEPDVPGQGERPADRRLTAWLLHWARPYTRRVAAATLLVIAGSALQIVGPLLTAAAVDLYLKPRPEAAAIKVQRALAALGLPVEGGWGLATLAGIYLVSLLLGALLMAAQARTMMMTGQLVMRDLRAELFAHLQRLDLAWFNRTPAGRIITRLTSDVEALNEIFTSGLVEILSDLVLLGGIAGVLFALDWRLALVALCVLPFMVLLSSWFRHRARSIYREVRTRIAAINTHLQEHIAGMSVVQLARAETRTGKAFLAIDAAHRDINIRGVFYYAVFYPAIELLTAGGLALLLAFGGIWTTNGTVSLGVLIAFLQYVQRFYRPISDLAENYNVLQASLAAAERLFALLETKAEIVSAPSLRPEPARRGALALEGVSFAYEPGQWALKDISFTVRPGERIAVVGHTGAGKSTLVNLLLRFYDPQEGAVTVDGVDVREWDLTTLRRRFAVVLQEVDCFAGTLRDNVGLGRPGLDDARIRRALEEVQAGPMLSRLPLGIDTSLGERGAGLSAGERQLVSFARALVADPEFLVLDEATAAVDAVTENAIQTALDRLLAGRTSVVIAHRLATVMGCDRVLVLHAGRLIEEGTHEELLEQGGLYRTLYELQLLHPAEEAAAPAVAAPGAPAAPRAASDL